MQHSRGKSRQTQLGGGDEHKGLSEAWSQLGKARRELRRMEHRLGEAQVATDRGEQLASFGGSIPGPTAYPDQTYLLTEHPATARFVDVRSPVRAAPQGSSTKRKVSRLDDKSVKSSSRSNASPGRQRQAVRTDPDDERVDFAQRLQLREVRWDSTFRDTHPDPGYVEAGPGYMDTAPGYMEAGPGYTQADTNPTPHPSRWDGPGGELQQRNNHTLTDSRALRETEVRFLNDSYVTEPLQRDRDRDRFQERHPHPQRQFQERSAASRLTRVEVGVPGGRTADVIPPRHLPLPSQPSRPPPHPQPHHLQGSWSASGQAERPPRDPARTQQSRGTNGGPVAGGGMGGGETGDPPSSLAEAGAVGGASLPQNGAARERSRSVSASRMQKIKKTLKELPRDDRLLSQLREKIRHQRISASSSDNSYNESMASSTNMDHTRELTPRHMFHYEQEAVMVGEDGLIAPDRPPRTRKVAAGPPAPSYRGFSEPHMEPYMQNQVNAVNRLAHPKRKTADPVQTGFQVQLKPHNSASTSSVLPSSTSTPNSKEKPRKTARVVSSSSKRPSKPGAKNVITTSSWRAGQEVVARELGLPAPKRTHSREERTHSREERTHSREEWHRVGMGQDDQRRPDGAEGNLANSGRVPATGSDAATSRPAPSGRDIGSQLAQSKALSDDAKKLFSDLHLDNNSDRVPPRPAVKRKAPKAASEREAEKPEPIEKQRHYDSESVRQYMARQKAERQRQREDARREEERQMQKRQKLMQELISKQKMAVATAAAAAANGAALSGAASKLKKVKRAGQRGTSRTLFPADQHALHEERIRALLAGDGEREHMEVDEDNSDADTLTGDSEEGSTPRATPVNSREEATAKPMSTFDLLLESNARPRHAAPAPTLPAPHLSFHDPGSASLVAAPGAATKTIEINGKKINLNVGAVLSRFSQVVSQRQGSSVGFGEGSSGSGFDGAERSRQERLLNLKESAREIQTKISTAACEISSQKHEPEGQPFSPSPEFVTRYDRISGSREAFGVFTSNLPGMQNVTVREASTDRPPSQSVGSDRHPSQSVGSDWHPSQSVGSAARSQIGRVSHAASSRPAGLTVGGIQNADDDDDSVTETSTFSEVTATDISDNKMPKRHLKQSSSYPQETGVLKDLQYRAPVSNLQWETPHCDPYSVLNVFSRQQRHGVPVVGHPSRSGDNSQKDGTRVTEPRVTSTQQVVIGQTPEGHPTMMRTTYTRMEATLRHEPRSQQSQASSKRNRPSRSEANVSERVKQGLYSSRGRSVSEDTPSLDSEEEAAPKAVSSHAVSKKAPAVAYGRQVSADTGQETDVSQLSEDEPRVSMRSYDRPALDMTQDELGTSRWSPGALERQMAAELARLESLEDSIRQLSSAERTRAVALAQQETVSVAQVLKARQQAHSAELRSLQLQVQEERLLSARKLQEQLYSSKGVQAPASDMLSLAVPPPPTTAETGHKENLRAGARVTNTSPSRTSRARDDTEYTDTFTTSRESKPVVRSLATRSSTDTTQGSALVRTAEDSAALSAPSVETAEDSVKTAGDSQMDSDSSIRTASDAERPRAGASSAEPVPSGDYSLSFEESSVTGNDSYRQTDREAKRHKASKVVSEDISSYRLIDLPSIYGGEDSFNRFSIDIIRNIMREEEMRAQHQETLLKIRERALKKKTRAQLSLIQQERLQTKDRAKGDETLMHKELKRLADKESVVKREHQEHKAEIARMFKSEELAREHRKSLLKQHEHIAKLQEETREKMKLLQGRLDQSAVDGHTEDETSLMEDLSDVSDASFAQGNKTREKQKLDKQQKLRLDQKYLTVREQRLKERERQAKELLAWRQNLDAQEEKVLQLEHNALQAWDPTSPAMAAADRKREGTEKKVKAAGNLRPEPAGARFDSAISPRAVRTDPAITPRSAVDSYTPFSESQAVSTHISVTESRHKRSGADNATGQSRSAKTRSSQDSENSVPEDIPDGSSDGRHRSTVTPDKHRLDTSDDTIVNSSVDEDVSISESGPRGKKSSVGRLLPPGNSPLPQPWSRRAGSESESEAESVSHTETQSDVSDYEVRIRQLSDMLRKRRKEADMLKKERSKRMKEKLRAQEESLKKQLEAYEVFIAQVKSEQADLEQEGSKPTVPPKIKQPHASKTRSSPTSSPSPSRQSHHPDDANYSSSFDGTDSSQTSPALSEKDSKLSPLMADKLKKKSLSPSSLMDRISEGSESLSERAILPKGKKDKSLLEASLSEAIEEAVNSAASLSEKSSAVLNIKTSEPTKIENEERRASTAEENYSYSQDLTEPVSVSHSHVPVSRRSDLSGHGHITKSEVSEAIESVMSTAKSDDAPSAPKLDLTPTKDTSSRPATGIPESDSESERVNSHRTLSRPSSERSTGSTTTISDSHDFDEEEEDIISSESDHTPIKASVASAKDKERSAAGKTEEDVSEHISVSLPSISERRSGSQTGGLGQQGSLHADIAQLCGEEEDATPTTTPRPESPAPDKQEDEIVQDPLLMTDPLADFHEGDRVLVTGAERGTLRFKGTVHFAPGFWAGVELDWSEGELDGEKEGKRYFTCPDRHGVLVPGSDISPLEERSLGKGERDLEEHSLGKGERDKGSSIDESFDELSSATDKSNLSRQLSRESRPEEEVAVVEKMIEVKAGPGKDISDRHNLALLADDITADLTKSLMDDSLLTINAIAERLSPKKTPPPTLPEPEKSPPATLLKPGAAEKSPPTVLPKPKLNNEQQSLIEKESQIRRREVHNHRVDKTTTSVVDGLLDDAISKMILIHRSRHDDSGVEQSGHNSALEQPLSPQKSRSRLNGHLSLSDNDSGVDPSHDSSLDPALGTSPEPEINAGDVEELRRPMSPEPFSRPKSPVPVNSSQQEDDDDYDFAGLRYDQEFFDDDDYDYGLSAKPPPPYPGAGDQARSSSASGPGANSPVPVGAKQLAADLFIIPHHRKEVNTIVAEAVDIYWNLRRCGEPWEAATVPAEYLEDKDKELAKDGEELGSLVTSSRRTFRRLVFDLTGEIVRDIYANENETIPPPWQKQPIKRQRYFKGRAPPITVDILLPVVQSAVTDILGLNGSLGRYRGKSLNKWSVKKKKDHVDCVLTEELREEEADWVTYDADELEVKMQLTDTILESLLADTVSAVNKVYSRRSPQGSLTS